MVSLELSCLQKGMYQAINVKMEKKMIFLHESNNIQYFDKPISKYCISWGIIHL